MKPQIEDRAGTNAAERLIDVIELLVDHPRGMALSEIARTLGLAKSATHRLLTSLVHRNYVEQPPGREEYRLGLKISSLGFRYAAHLGLLDVCQPLIDRLATETGELVRMAIADERGLAWVAKSQGTRFGLRYDADMGSPVVLHATASGRSWLMTLPQAEAIALVEARGFAVPELFGKQVVRSVEDLIAEFECMRKRGYALSMGEVVPGAAAVAIAIPRHNRRRSPGAISVAGPIVRMTAAALKDIVPRLSAVVAEVGELWPILEGRGSDGYRVQSF